MEIYEIRIKVYILDKSRMGGLACNDSKTATDDQGNRYTLYLFSVGKSAINDFPYKETEFRSTWEGPKWL